MFSKCGAFKGSSRVSSSGVCSYKIETNKSKLKKKKRTKKQKKKWYVGEHCLRPK